MRYAALSLALVIVCAAIGYMNHRADVKTQWCPQGERAVLVDSGYGADGTPVALYACDSELRVKL